ncbi:HAD-IIIC family phosphatase [Streptomyces zagrosensis]|uniref:FkbH-like protein n=1 Tax=Streptomyces zagrosensis TaxID=1042984 RepID=A0A7W9QH88_9ACTN|nr:HAD-IIIC family phosphatase [Streptomyces zagrosensis]MBB5938992.1 FkbH-like protein [Streptomyces zagrosensis]
MPELPELVKCVIWDLDDTLWDGTLIEGDTLSVPRRNRDLVRRLDTHGILQSVASRNDEEPALAVLEETGLAEYFLYPQIGWAAKSASVGAVVRALDIAPSAVLFVDDSDFERAEVASELPEVGCVTPGRLHELVDQGRVLPASVTPDAARRRQLYRAEQCRRDHEAAFTGPAEEFLRSLRMRLTIRPATAPDLVRAAELTQRTHQLNTTGITFNKAELAALCRDGSHRVLVAELEDAFGTYGTIGLAVIDAAPPDWTVRLLLMSCRVLGRNIGTAVLAAVGQLAAADGAGLRAHFRPTERNRQMRLTYRFLGFRTTETTADGLVVLELPDPAELTPPAYVDLRVEAAPETPTTEGMEVPS